MKTNIKRKSKINQVNENIWKIETKSYDIIKENHKSKPISKLAEYAKSLYIDTHSHNYVDVNKALRNGEQVPKNYNLDHLMEAFTQHKASYTIDTYRGVGKYHKTMSDMQIGDIFTDLAFTSVTTSPKSAIPFSYSNTRKSGKWQLFQSFLLHIVIPEGTRFGFGESKEKEITLPAGQKFVIEGFSEYITINEMIGFNKTIVNVIHLRCIT